MRPDKTMLDAVNAFEEVKANLASFRVGGEEIASIDREFVFRVKKLRHRIELALDLIFFGEVDARVLLPSEYE
jgi:hypothetical protein